MIPPLQGSWYVYSMIRRHGCLSVWDEFNGIGPEWAGGFIRAILTRAFAEFIPAAFIHDVRVGFRSDIGSHAANRELLTNCILLAGCSARPRFLKAAAYLVYWMCETFGERF